MPNNSNPTLVAAVSMISFAIQQFLQFFDPFISRLPWLQESAKTTAATVANRKKALMGVLSFFLGLLVVNVVKDLTVLDHVGLKGHTFLDPIVSALIVGAGTETSNTVQKLLSYLKDKAKPAPAAAQPAQ